MNIHTYRCARTTPKRELQRDRTPQEPDESALWVDVGVRQPMDRGICAASHDGFGRTVVDDDHFGRVPTASATCGDIATRTPIADDQDCDGWHYEVLWPRKRER